MTLRFAELIHLLGEELDTDLEVDSQGSCSLIIDEKLLLQIEPTKDEEILIGTAVGEIPPGKYREEILKAALIANSDPLRSGTFAYNEPTNELILFTLLPSLDLDEKKLAEQVAAIIETALAWHTTLTSGTLPPSLSEIKPLSAY